MLALLAERQSGQQWRSEHCSGAEARVRQGARSEQYPNAAGPQPKRLRLRRKLSAISHELSASEQVETCSFSLF